MGLDWVLDSDCLSDLDLDLDLDCLEEEEEEGGLGDLVRFVLIEGISI